MLFYIYFISKIKGGYMSSADSGNGFCSLFISLFTSPILCVFQMLKCDSFRTCEWSNLECHSLTVSSPSSCCDFIHHRHHHHHHHHREFAHEWPQLLSAHLFTSLAKREEACRGWWRNNLPFNSFMFIHWVNSSLASDESHYWYAWMNNYNPGWKLIPLIDND